MIDIDKLKKAILKQGLSQGALAQLCKCKQPAISQIISSVRPVSSIMAVKLINIFGQCIVEDEIILMDMRCFEYKHLPESLQKTSKPIGDLAQRMNRELPEGVEKLAGLRMLMEAKDCFMRAGIGYKAKGVASDGGDTKKENL